MNFEAHYRNADIKAAKQEFACAIDLITLITLNTRVGKIERAKELGEDLLRSMENLVQLNKRKQADDEYQELIGQLIQKGVDAQSVRMYFHDR